MGIKFKNLFFLLLQLNTFQLFSQGIEEQRKYVVNSNAAFIEILNPSSTLNGLSFQNHSIYNYFDIYLDTPEFDLYRNNLSLRFRKRIFENGEITYGMQLKSEMSSESSIRMEVEETELDFYTIKVDTGFVKLTSVLDILFNQVEQNKINPFNIDIENAIKLIQTWVKFKAESCIIPFQKLIFLKINGLDVEKIRELIPVIFGSDKRLRSYVYIDKNNTTESYKDILNTTQNFDMVPEFFKNNNNCVWMLETSLDSAVFFPLYKTKLPSVSIKEFEVENKYKPSDKGKLIMEQLEISLKNRIDLQIQFESKYRQCINQFNIK